VNCSRSQIPRALLAIWRRCRTVTGWFMPKRLSMARTKSWIIWVVIPHRVAISNNRLKELKDGKVSFTYKDYKHEQRQKVMTLSADEFLRRFLLHVLPSSFQRIRHYGLLGNRHRAENLARCRELLAMLPPIPEPTRNYRERCHQLTGIDPLQCPKCNRGTMVRIAAVHPYSRANLQLTAALPASVCLSPGPSSSKCHFPAFHSDHFHSRRRKIPASFASISSAADEPPTFQRYHTPLRPFKTHSLRASPAA
jgi:hypothetical protein